MTEVYSGVDRTPRPSPSDGGPADLGQVLARLRRALRRAVRRRLEVEQLSEAQLELVRLVEATPGIRISEAATVLGVAPNTISTLVSRLTEASLLDRSPDPSDGRGGRLALTPAAEARFSAWRGQRAHILEQAASKLDAEDGAAIEAAIPAMWRLSRMLEELDER